MDLWDFPALSQAETPEEAAPEIEKLRQPDDSWIKETPLACHLEDWRIEPSQRRYTVTVEDVPFECLYLPGKGKKLYVMLSGGGAGVRRVPLFLRWKWRNYLDGHMLFIDDPMYHFHPGITHVMWYYGTKEIPYLPFALEIEKKAMEQLAIPSECVVHVGSSGGGYSSLYLCNMLNYSSAIAFNPQLILKPWQYPGVYKNFLKWGIDLEADDPFSRNQICLDNPTCYFFICINYESKADYEIQFQPFAEKHGIPVRYGISQRENYITWLHATKYSNLHTANPEEIGFLSMDHWLEKARSGANLNEIHSASLAANEILYQKYAMRNRAETAEKDKAIFRNQFFSLISQMITEEWEGLKKNSEHPFFRQNQTTKLSPKVYSFWINYFLETRQDVYYQILFHKHVIYFRLLRRLSALGEKKDVWLKYAQERGDELKDSAHYGWHLREQDRFAIGTVLGTENQRQTIRDFILRTMDLWRDE